MMFQIYDVNQLRDTLNRAFPSITPAHNSHGHRYKNEETQALAWSVTTKLGFVSKEYLYTWYAKKAVEYIKENHERIASGDTSVYTEAVRAGERSRDNSAGIGTTAHEAFDKYLQSWIDTSKPPITSCSSFLNEGSKPDEICATRSFDLFIKENEIIPIASEIKVWYEKGKDSFAGTVDAVFLCLSTHKERTGDTGCSHDYAVQPKGIWWCAICGREAVPQLILEDHKTSNAINGKDDYAHQSTAYAKAIERATGWKFDGLWVVRLDKEEAAYEICKVSDTKKAWKEFLAISRAFDAKESRGVESLLVPLLEKETIKI